MKPMPVLLEVFEEAELKALEKAGWVIRRAQGNPAVIVGENGSRRIYGRTRNEIVAQALGTRGKP
jgi:hypothetical protein